MNQLQLMGRSSNFDYLQGAAFERAKSAQRFICERFDNDKDVIHEFRNATSWRYAEWVASVTPYGEEAHKVQRWQEDNFATADGKLFRISGMPDTESHLPDGPVFLTVEEGLGSLRDVVAKVHLYFNPPEGSNARRAKSALQFASNVLKGYPFTQRRK